MSDFKLRKIRDSSDLHMKRVGECIECGEPVTELGMPYVHDLKTNTIKTVAKIVYEDEYCLEFEKGYVARPLCGNMACINPKHIKCVKA